MLKKYFGKLKGPANHKNHYFLDLPNGILRDDKVSYEQYVNNVIVHRCVSLIAASASHVPWKVYKNRASIPTLNNSHFINRLLKRPNPEISGADFFTETISNLLLYGNSYLALSGANNTEPSGMYNLHPKWVEITTINNKATGYKYRGNSTERFYGIDQVSRISRVLHFKNYHPNNSLYGLSPLEAAAKSINLYSQTLDWNKSLLKNAARPSGALVFQDSNGYLTDEQFERLQQQFYDNFSGFANSGKPLILEGGLQWQETNNAEKFEKFLELKDSSARDIAIAFNVPPQLLGINGDNTYSNMQEARLALWEENIIPLLDRLADGLSNWFSYWFNDDIRVDFDRDSISALTQRRENIWAKVANASFMTINEKRAVVGLGEIPDGNKIPESNN